MSKIISSHNLSELEKIEINIEKNLLLSKILLNDFFDYSNDDKDFIISFLCDVNSELYVSMNNLNNLDKCIRKEINFNSDCNCNENEYNK